MLCVTQVTNNSEANCITLYNAHIPTHTASEASETIPKSRVPPGEKPNMEVNTPQAEMKSSKSFKTPTDEKPAKSTHQCLGCQDSNLLKLLPKEDDEPKGLIEENLFKIIKCIVARGESAWCQRRKLHQMTQGKGELVRSFATRLRKQAKQCRFIMTCRAEGCNQSNDFTDIVIMDKLVQGLIDKDIKK